MKKFVVIILTICSGAANSMTVFDPAVWIQTNATAISTVRNEIQTAQMLYNQVIQLQNQLKQGIVSAATQQLMMRDPMLGSMLSNCVLQPAQTTKYGYRGDAGQVASGAAGSLERCLSSIGNNSGRIVQIDSQMLSTLEDQQLYLTNVQANYAAKGVSSKTYAETLATSAAAGNAKAQDLINTNQNINAQLAIVSAKRKAIAEQMPNVAGTTDSINLTTNAIDNLTELTMAMTVMLKKDIEMRAGTEAKTNSQYQQFLHDREVYNQQLKNRSGGSTSASDITKPF